MQFPKPEHKPSKFGRQQYAGKPAAPVTRSKRAGKVVRCDAPAPVQVKTEPKRCPALLEMARDRPCLLRVPGVCNGLTATTVAAHSGLSIHHKGAGRKADDQFSVWSCSACHIPWLDQGPAPAAEKEFVFMSAHIRQVDWWRRIATDPKEPARFRKAAMWALEQLNASPLGLLDAP